jgi:hypothetical protein
MNRRSIRLCPECGELMKKNSYNIYFCENEDCILQQCRFYRWGGSFNEKYVGPEPITWLGGKIN